MPAPITQSPFVPPAPASLFQATPAEQAAGPDFSDLLRQAVERTGGIQQDADMAVMQSLAGGDVTQVEVLSAVKKADLALRMMIQVRNKLLDAYNEIQQIRF
jgi:flagellar hook-basal body complex protein FliE